MAVVYQLHILLLELDIKWWGNPCVILSLQNSDKTDKQINFIIQKQSNTYKNMSRWYFALLPGTPCSPFCCALKSVWVHLQQIACTHWFTARCGQKHIIRYEDIWRPSKLGWHPSLLVLTRHACVLWHMMLSRICRLDRSKNSGRARMVFGVENSCTYMYIPTAAAAAAAAAAMATTTTTTATTTTTTKYLSISHCEAFCHLW